MGKLNLALGVIFVGFACVLARSDLEDIWLIHRLFVALLLFWAGARLILHDTILTMVKWESAKYDGPLPFKIEKISTGLILLAVTLFDFVVSAFILGPGIMLSLAGLSVGNPIVILIGACFLYYGFVSIFSRLDPELIVRYLER